ncbi:MAG: FAD-dependent oxidoreductase [Gammaproteobacteria bacterium]|nr:FAD-dependent oxidoreductase [Gammaproteobacteria bacterium]MBT8075497.1 FAD-dependent oxidoreductase [Gammaproteobacteria bacterium]NNK98913.1 NAD(P)-binding protein [Xanthomonadales bacterium]
MKIAVVGTGIAGNVAAYYLNKHHDVSVFEADNRIGGHTNTVDVELGGRHYAVDTGFIVFNNRTYPNFIELLDELGVASQDSDMSFSMRNDNNGLEYKGSTLNTLFAQRRNLIRPSFYRMIRDILRFEREAPEVLEPGAAHISIGEFLESRKYSSEFIEHYIIPMGAAIWSAQPVGMRDMPAKFFVRFFRNHGLLSVDNRPTWRVIKGGSNRYVEKLVAGHRDRIHLQAPVQSISRSGNGVELKVKGSEPLYFDHVFLACHSDQALRMLKDPSDAEKEVLGAIRFQTNEAVLHTDTRLMPCRKLAWAAWNYHILAEERERVALTYNMNILQGLDAPEQFCVSLNNSDKIDPDRILEKIDYSHPVFTEQSIAAQARHQEINGVKRTYYCGAYWRYGFHEDGVLSALNALEHFAERSVHEKRDFRRVS